MKKQIWIWVAVSLVVTILLLGTGALWWASNQLLFPKWNGVSKDFKICTDELAAYWGEHCGNLRNSGEFQFSEVQIQSLNGYKLPGWLVESDKKEQEQADGAMMLIHGGGSDRREVSSHIRFFLEQGFDVLTFDLGCHGEAPCPVPGLSYGSRESQDVLSAYHFLVGRYDRVYAKGFSVGAASILIALPHMQQLSGAIAVNPYLSFRRLIKDAPEADGAPEWFLNGMLSMAMIRGNFNDLMSPEHALPIAFSETPVLFIHSRLDEVTPYHHTITLSELYKGPSSLWIPDYGSHSVIKETDPQEYEQKLLTFLNSEQ